MAVTLYKERVEVALPVCHMAALVQTKLFSCFDESGRLKDTDEARQGYAELLRIRSLVDRGLCEPMTGLKPALARLCGKHIDKVHEYGTVELAGQTGEKIALVTYYFLKDLLDTEWLVLWEGSPVGEAINSLVPMMQEYFEVKKLDESAQKQARRIKARYQEKGYYQ
jgi:hypothetical protein